jgi:hypothetical protein
MTTIMNKAEFMAEGFTAEIRRAMSGRVVIADMDAGLAAPDAA